MKFLPLIYFLSLLFFLAPGAVYPAESYVVLGSYHNKQSATQEADRLAQTLGINLSVASVGDSHRLLYRIIAGPQQEPATQSIKRTLKTAGIHDVWVLRENPDVIYTAGLPGSEKTPATDNTVLSSRPRDDLIPSDRTGDIVAAASSPSANHTDRVQPDIQRNWTLRGYLKSYQIGQQGIAFDDAPSGMLEERSTYQSQNSIRLNFEGAPSDNLAWELHYELTQIFYSVPPENNPIDTSTVVTGSNNYRTTDIEPVLGTAREKSTTRQNLDRLNVQFRLEPGDVTIGRQAIAFGSARAINPTDVFLPFEFQTLNQEYRIGVDAIRFQQPTGELGELDMGIILGRDAEPENSAVYIQVLNNFSGVDIHGTLMRFSEQNLAGFGMESALGDFGFWFEAAHVWNGDEYLRASIGLDYAFTENLYGMLEYHFNGAGSRSPKNYLDLLDDFAYQKGGVFLLGQNYLIPALNWTASPLLGITLQAIVNLDDSSTFFNLSGEYSLAENLYSDLGVYVFTGDHLKFTTMPPNLLLGSEYGIYPNLAFISLRYYF